MAYIALASSGTGAAYTLYCSGQEPQKLYHLGEFYTISPHPPPLPSSPSLRVLAVHLGRIDYDQSGMLGVRMALTVVAENDNRAATAGFSDISFTLSFHRIDVALLRNARFIVPRNGSWPLKYDVQAVPILLRPTPTPYKPSLRGRRKRKRNVPAKVEAEKRKRRWRRPRYRRRGPPVPVEEKIEEEETSSPSLPSPRAAKTVEAMRILLGKRVGARNGYG
uniref:Late embryogenesis abundant protein LEA-2 subgroup domain-containing protein n=1 Tax=Ananas comosus var. bracteatus TaxID=296719 RepID=A0A6V7PSA2_ANACO|nr:unnamed protein product [Ananas comosus var. bracteatus]